MPKIFLSTMLNESMENLSYLHELVDPVLSYIDGLIVVVHGENQDKLAPCASYLESVKGCGEIIYRKWVKRHDVSMNETLYTDKVEEGSVVLWIDLNETLSPEFVVKLKYELIPAMAAQGIDMIAFCGKLLAFVYNEHIRYQGSPHWGMTGFRRGVEYSQVEADENKVRKNMRPLRRDKMQFVKHFCNYYLYPAGSNQCALGLDHLSKDPQEQQKIFQEREIRRLTFRGELRKRNIPLTTDAVIEMMRGGMDETMKEFVRKEQILNNVYRMYVLGDKDFPCVHDGSTMVEVK